MHAPDPTFSASIYSADHVEEIVRGAVVPFYDELARRGLQERWLLWMVRYNRCGRHLKLRLHGPEAERALVQGLLADAVAAHFATPDAPVEASRPASKRKSLPVDLEDERDEDYPDRTVLWTHYRRSQVTLGPSLPLLEDDRYAALFTTCMARGAALVLEALRGEITGSGRLKVLLGALAAAITGAGFTDEEREAYHAYHRDWLLHFILDDQQKDAEIRAQFDGRLPGMQGVLDTVRGNLARGLEGLPAEDADDARREGAWREAVAALYAYVAQFRGQAEYVADPFSDDPVFPVLFKVMHGMSNQLGVSMLNEALVHHVVLHALRTPAAALAGA